MFKYNIKIKFNNGISISESVDKIHFNSGKGGIDIYDTISSIPYFPGKEEDVKEIIITLPWAVLTSDK